VREQYRWQRPFSRSQSKNETVFVLWLCQYGHNPTQAVHPLHMPLLITDVAKVCWLEASFCTIFFAFQILLASRCFLTAHHHKFD
jgi:hypothetical protein